MTVRSTIMRLCTPLASLLLPLLAAAPASAQIGIGVDVGVQLPGRSCDAACLSPGDHDFVVQPDLVPRTFKAFVPDSYDGSKRVPLLIDLHGFTSTAGEERAASGQREQARARGFIAVWPQGLGLSWNGYGCCATSKATQVRDVRFIREVIAFMQRRAAIDPARIYVTGISNGGSLAHRMACEAADVVTAVVAVSFPLNRDSCTPVRPITVIEVAGTADDVIDYGGKRQDAPVSNIAGAPVRIQSAEDSLAAWRAINRCTGTLTHRTLDYQGRTGGDGDVYEDAFNTCEGGVRTGLVTVVGGGHLLYDGHQRVIGERADVPLNVAAYIWNTVFVP